MVLVRNYDYDGGEQRKERRAQFDASSSVAERRKD